MSKKEQPKCPNCDGKLRAPRFDEIASDVSDLLCVTCGQCYRTCADCGALVEALEDAVAHTWEGDSKPEHFCHECAKKQGFIT